MRCFRGCNNHRSALRGTPGSVYPQPEPNATELPSCAPLSARAAQRRRRRRWWRGEEGARRPGPEGQVLRHVLWHVTSRSSATPCATSFTCSPFTSRPPLPLGLPHQPRTSNVQRARDDEETADEETLGGRGGGGQLGQATGGGVTHVLMCWAWTLPGVGLASGSLRAAAYLFCAWVPPLEDDACHDEHLQQLLWRWWWWWRRRRQQRRRWWWRRLILEKPFFARDQP